MKNELENHNLVYRSGIDAGVGADDSVGRHRNLHTRG